MLLHQVSPIHKLKKKRPRVGRGGKRGTYSGRGQKGQKAHAGRRIKPAVYELITRLPKLRGYKHRSIKPRPLLVKIGDLAKIKGEVIDLQSLQSAGLVSQRRLQRAAHQVKILGDGQIKKAIKLVLGRKFGKRQLAISQSARLKIEQAGGTIVDNNQGSATSEN